jgi:hypothetical protein
MVSSGPLWKGISSCNPKIYLSASACTITSILPPFGGAMRRAGWQIGGNHLIRWDKESPERGASASTLFLCA